MEIRSESLSDFNLIPNSELSIGTETPSSRTKQAGGFFWSKSAPTAICQKAIKAAMEQKHDVVDFLIMEGCVPNYAEVDENKNTILHHIGGDYSNFDKYPTIVDKILKDPNVKDFINIQNVDGNTPLHIAALAGNVDMARKLHEAGADLDIKNGGGFQVAAMTVDSDMQSEAKHVAANNATTESIKDMVEKYIESPKKTASVGGSSSDTEKFLNELATKYAKQTGGHHSCDCDCCDHPGKQKTSAHIGGSSETESSDLIPPPLINDITPQQVKQLGYTREQLLKSGITQKRVNELIPAEKEWEYKASTVEKKKVEKYEGRKLKLEGGSYCDCDCECHYKKVPSETKYEPEVVQAEVIPEIKTQSVEAPKGISNEQLNELAKRLIGDQIQDVTVFQEANKLGISPAQQQFLVEAAKRKQEEYEKERLAEIDKKIDEFITKLTGDPKNEGWMFEEIHNLGATDEQKKRFREAFDKKEAKAKPEAPKEYKRISDDAMNKLKEYINHSREQGMNALGEAEEMRALPEQKQELLAVYMKKYANEETAAQKVIKFNAIYGDKLDDKSELFKHLLKLQNPNRQFNKDDSVINWVRNKRGKVVELNLPMSDKPYKVKYDDSKTAIDEGTRFLLSEKEWNVAITEFINKQTGGADPTMTEDFLSGLLVQLNGGGKQSSRVTGTRRLNNVSEGEMGTERSNQLARMMSNQSNEIHKEVLNKIIKFLPKIDKKYAKLDEKEAEDVARNFKAVLWQVVKKNKELVSNLDQSNKLLELTTLKELKNIDPEEGNKLREESRKRREERQKGKKGKREPKEAPKAEPSEGDYDLSDTSSDFVPQTGGYSQTSFSFNILSE